MKSVLVIGSKGFIGNYVVKELEKRNYNVIEFDKKISPNQDTLICNIKDFRLDVDYVINLASLVGLKHCMDNPVNAVHENVLSPTRVYELFSQYADVDSIKFVHISTWAVKGNLENPYDVTKLAGENMFMSYLKRGILKGAVCRLGTTYGPGMSKLGVIPTMLKKAKNNEPLTVHGRGEQIRQFTFCEDTARGIVDVMEKGENQETYYVVADEITSVKEIAESMSKDIVYTEAREGDEDYKPIDNSKIKKLGWKPLVSFKEGVERMKDEI